MNVRNKVNIVGATDPGLVRDHNEDFIGQEAEIGLAVLADGMGGLKAGEVASAMAVNVVTDALLDVMRGHAHEPVGDRDGLGPESDLIRDAVLKANATIYNVAQTQPQCAGMGTTIVALLFYDNRVSIAHIGDSRLYRLRDGVFEQVTRDHSLIQELIDKGYYTKEEARNANNKNIVTRALGINEEVECEVQEADVAEGDLLLMCSDGLNDMVEDGHIHEILSANRDDLDAAARALIEAAKEGGGKDNISVVLADCIKPFPAKDGWLTKLTGMFN